MARGRHVTLDGFVARNKWPEPGVLMELLQTAAIASGATPLDSRVIPLPCEKSRPDSPPGGTAWIGLDESHVTMHWYTEETRVLFAMDAFTCGTVADPIKLIDMVKEQLGAEQIGDRIVLGRFEEGDLYHR